ncbi:hypothetical protein ACFW9I_22110 [[Kitasatospora] papulosa]|uniref:hypothetical protein n=1 Tax=[Kitasatospora] papulosa TaxID=1464011 RepID=UPI0036AB5A37
MLPCLITGPALAVSALTNLVPGDELRITGQLQLRSPSRPPMCLYVLTLETLTTPPVPSTSEMRFERDAPYIVVLDADHTSVPVWAETGTWAGVAEDPGAITQVLVDYERRQSTAPRGPLGIAQVIHARARE